MLSRIAQRTVRAVKPTMATRSFGEVLSIPVDKEQQTGRRKEELDAEAAGHVGFNKDPIIPAADAGTRENPILVPSGYPFRTVGFEDPSTHSVQWFNLNKGKIHYVQSIGLFFKLSPVA